MWLDVTEIVLLKLDYFGIMIKRGSVYMNEGVFELYIVLIAFLTITYFMIRKRYTRCSIMALPTLLQTLLMYGYIYTAPPPYYMDLYLVILIINLMILIFFFDAIIDFVKYNRRRIKVLKKLEQRKLNRRDGNV